MNEEEVVVVPYLLSVTADNPMAGETCCEMISNALMRCPLCFAGEVSHQEQVGDFGQLDEGETFAYQKLLPAPNLNLFSFILLDPSSRLGIPS